MSRLRSVARAAVATLAAAALACTSTAIDGGATPAGEWRVATSTTEEQPMSADETAAVEAWRAKRLASLQAPTGWLTLVGLEWLAEGANRLGSAADADVTFPAKAPANLGTITRHGESLTLEPAPGSDLTVGGKPVAGAVPLTSDAAGEPTTVAWGPISFYVIQRGDRWAVRIKDSESPVRTGFRGLENYPLRADWRIVAHFEPAPPGTTLGVPNILGMVEESASPGSVVFTRDGHEVRLQAIDEGDGRLFLVFGDSTNGKGTYGGGRFVYADPPVPGESTVVVDFNRAYNPPCVFTPYATCPLPPKVNWLPVRVEAGEKAYAGAHAP